MLEEELIDFVFVLGEVVMQGGEVVLVPVGEEGDSLEEVDVLLLLPLVILGLEWNTVWLGYIGIC